MWRDPVVDKLSTLPWRPSLPNWQIQIRQFAGFPGERVCKVCKFKFEKFSDQPALCYADRMTPHDESRFAHPGNGVEIAGLFRLLAAHPP
jgi:hypothetical protein